MTLMPKTRVLFCSINLQNQSSGYHFNPFTATCETFKHFFREEKSKSRRAEQRHKRGSGQLADAARSLLVIVVFTSGWAAQHSF